MISRRLPPTSIVASPPPNPGTPYAPRDKQEVPTHPLWQLTPSTSLGPAVSPSHTPSLGHSRVGSSLSATGQIGYSHKYRGRSANSSQGRRGRALARAIPPTEQGLLRATLGT